MAVSINNSNTESTLNAFFSEPDPIISDEVLYLVGAFLSSVMFPFSVLGSVTNAINIRVFIQQGVTSDTNTICLFCLAIADLLGCFLLIPRNVCQVLKYTTSSTVISVSCRSLVTITFNITHVLMSHITCWVTVYIAVERCLCVLIPFKVKIILRPKVAIVAMTSIYVTIIGSFIPWYMNFGIEVNYNKDYNATLLIITQTELGKIVHKYNSLIFNTVLSSTAISITSVAAGLMLYKLNKYRRWREKTACASTGKRVPGNESNNDSNQSASVQGRKDREILKTVTMVTALFVVCLSMSLIPGFVSALVTGTTVAGKNKNLVDLFYVYKYVFDVINSSLNFFFYVNISSRYKAAYNEVFRKEN